MNETKPSCTTQLKVKSLLFQLGGYTLKWVDFEQQQGASRACADTLNFV